MITRFRKTRRVLKYFFYTLLGLFVIFYLASIYTTYKIRRVCAELPNGLRIGHEAFTAPRRYRWRPVYVLKLSDGTILVPEAVNTVLFSKTTVYGNAGPIYGTTTHYDFAYRPDVGLVIKSKNLETYERLVREAGPRIWLGSRRGHDSLLSAYYEGIRNPAYRRERCHVNLFPEGTF